MSLVLHLQAVQIIAVVERMSDFPEHVLLLVIIRVSFFASQVIFFFFTRVGTLIVATVLQRRHAMEPNNVAYTTRYLHTYLTSEQMDPPFPHHAHAQ